MDKEKKKTKYGYTPYNAKYDRVLTSEEIRILHHKNPFCMFKKLSHWKVWRKEMKDKLIINICQIVRKVLDLW